MVKTDQFPPVLMLAHDTFRFGYPFALVRTSATWGLKRDLKLANQTTDA